MNRHKKYIKLFFEMLLIIIIVLYIFKIKNEKTEICIGVPLANDSSYRYDLLKNDLEKQFNVEINFIDLYTYMDSNDTEQDLMQDISNIVKANEVDMIIGVPSHQLELSIKDGLLMDITDKIENIENLHRGVIDRSKKLGEGKLYYVSPVINHISLVFQNKEILYELGIEPLPKYTCWEEFLIKLDDVQKKIESKVIEYSPLALSVKNINEELLFSAYDFQTLAFGLDSDIFEGNEFSKRWKDFYRIFSRMIINYGKDLKEMENGKFPKNYIFTNGKYAFMLGESYDAEVFFNKAYNEEYNKHEPVKINLDFPVEVSYVNYDATKTQNFRDTSIAINNNTVKKEITVQILNFLLGKKYAEVIIDRRNQYSYFSNSLFNYPTYYDEEIISKLNTLYEGKWDVHLLYDVEYGSKIHNTDQTNNSFLFDTSLNEGFTMIYNKRINNNIERIIEEGLEYTQNKLKRK